MARKGKSVEDRIKEFMTLPCNDEEGLLDRLGYNGKRDNAALVAAIILNKAQSGEMSCLKEVMRACNQNAELSCAPIKIIDDVK